MDEDKFIQIQNEKHPKRQRNLQKSMIENGKGSQTQNTEDLLASSKDESMPAWTAREKSGENVEDRLLLQGAEYKMK